MYCPVLLCLGWPLSTPIHHPPPPLSVTVYRFSTKNNEDPIKRRENMAPAMKAKCEV